MPINTPRLNHKQRQFVKHYMGRNPDLHGNATRSYKAAYGIVDTQSAAVGGSRLLQNPLIKDLVEKARQRLDEQIVADASFVLRESKRLYDRAMGDEPIPGDTVIDVDPETGDERVTVSERREYDPATARAALQLIGQHKSVQAFTVNVEHSHTHRLEQRLASRAKIIEGKAAQVDRDPLLTDQSTEGGQVIEAGQLHHANGTDR
jgi:phage terminase small subunit